jgi:hypothetical protein
VSHISHRVRVAVLRKVHTEQDHECKAAGALVRAAACGIEDELLECNDCVLAAGGGGGGGDSGSSGGMRRRVSLRGSEEADTEVAVLARGLLTAFV